MFCKANLWMRALGAVAILVLLQACAGTKPKTFGELRRIEVTDWEQVGQGATFTEGLAASIEFLETLPQDRVLGPTGASFQIAEYVAFLRGLKTESVNPAALARFLREEVDVWAVESGEAGPWVLDEMPRPKLQAKRQKSAGFESPVYGRPRDIVEIRLDAYRKAFPALTDLRGFPAGDIGSYPQAIFGRRGRKAAPGVVPEIVPYGKAVRGDTKIWGWVSEAAGAELQDLEVGVLEFSDGKQWQLGYGADNGLEATSAGKMVFFQSTDRPRSRQGARLVPGSSLDLGEAPIPMGALVLWRDEGARLLWGLNRIRRPDRPNRLVLLEADDRARSTKSGALSWIIPGPTWLARFRADKVLSSKN